MAETRKGRNVVGGGSVAAASDELRPHRGARPVAVRKRFWATWRGANRPDSAETVLGHWF